MRDAGILKKELDKNPKDAWAAYYLAQSYKDAGEHELAIEAYRYRLTLGGWDQEQYVSRMGVAQCLQALNRSEGEIVAAWLAAYEYRPQRRDALYHLMLYYRRAKRHELALLFGKQCAAIPKNKDTLFVSADAHGWPMYDHLGVAAALSGRAREAISACKLALMSCPAEERARIETNLRLCSAEVERADRQLAITKALAAPTDEKQAPAPALAQQPQQPQQPQTPKEQPKAPKVQDQAQAQRLAAWCEGDRQRVVIVVAAAWKPWSARSLRGPLGGSELAVIRMAAALSSDHSVLVLCPCDAPAEYDGVLYADASCLGEVLARKPPIRLWISSRYIDALRYDAFIQETWLWVHDTQPIGDRARIRAGTRVLALSQWHARLLKSLGCGAEGDVCVTSNGLAARALSEASAATVPLRFIYSSAAPRGLEALLDLWPAIVAQHPSAELHIFCDCATPYMLAQCGELSARLVARAAQPAPGVRWRGAVDQETLAIEQQRADVWLYPTAFSETYCITALEMQAYNVLCVYYPVAALCETVGDRGISVTKDTVLAVLDEWLADRPRIDAKKAEARAWALQQTWDRVADQWRGWLRASDQTVVNSTNVSSSGLDSASDPSANPSACERTLASASNPTSPSACDALEPSALDSNATSSASDQSVAPADAPSALHSNATSSTLDTSTLDQSALDTSAAPADAPSALDTSAAPADAPSALDTGATPADAPSALDTRAAPADAPSALDTGATPADAPSALDTSAAQSAPDQGASVLVEYLASSALPLVVIAAGLAWAPWSPRSLEGPLGGSETAVIRMADELARDHRVVVYCACSAPGRHGAVLYCDNAAIDALVALAPPIRLWIASRYTRYLRYDAFIQETWLWLHEPCPYDRVDAVRPCTRVLALCEWHARRLAAQRLPRISVTSNGIVPRALSEASVPLRFIYSSSALRGLEALLEFWPAIVAKHPSAELHVFSSLDTPFIRREAAAWAKRMRERAAQPGVVWRGAVDQATLAIEQQRADIWLYPTNFDETYCITAVEMQAHNVLCVYYPVAALCETVGDRGISVTKDNALAVLDEWLADRPRIDAKKAEARAWALQQTWGRVADQWRGWMRERDAFSIAVHVLPSAAPMPPMPLAAAIADGAVSAQADFLGSANADALAAQCAQHAALWRRAPAAWELVLNGGVIEASDASALPDLYPYLQSAPDDAEVLLLGCSWYARDDNQRHLDAVADAPPQGWRRVRRIVGGAFAYAFRGAALRQQLPLKRAVGNFEPEQLAIYLLVPQTPCRFVARPPLVYCGLLTPTSQ